MSLDDRATTRHRLASRRAFHLAIHLARRPGFCCGCVCLAPPDARRAKRIFRLTRAVVRDWDPGRRQRCPVPSRPTASEID
ncbi:MAG: hypothetical protein NW217_14700 [Hyphomicrobiaceae bacterium]|nr:hypothetical protein [Hyphomicrobiaceae bacterium]